MTSTAATGGYRIVDEPTPSGLAHLAVQPLWPLLAIMFGGAWASWPWFVVNGFAVGSPTRRRELAWALVGFAGSFVVVLGLVALDVRDVVGDVSLRYLWVGLPVWKIFVSYRLYLLQSRTYDLWRHFGGVSRNGLLVVFAAGFARGAVLGALPGLLRIVLS